MNSILSESKLMIYGLILEKIYELFVDRNKRNCPLYTGVRIKPDRRTSPREGIYFKHVSLIETGGRAYLREGA